MTKGKANFNSDVDGAGNSIGTGDEVAIDTGDEVHMDTDEDARDTEDDVSGNKDQERTKREQLQLQQLLTIIFLENG